MPQNDLQVLYQAASKKFNIGTYENFEAGMRDPKKRKSFYDAASKQFKLSSYENFNAKMDSLTSIPGEKPGEDARITSTPASPKEEKPDTVTYTTSDGQTHSMPRNKPPVKEQSVWEDTVPELMDRISKTSLGKSITNYFAGWNPTLDQTTNEGKLAGEFNSTLNNAEIGKALEGSSNNQIMNQDAAGSFDKYQENMSGLGVMHQEVAKMKANKFIKESLSKPAANTDYGKLLSLPTSIDSYLKPRSEILGAIDLIQRDTSFVQPIRDKYDSAFVEDTDYLELQQRFDQAGEQLQKTIGAQSDLTTPQGVAQAQQALQVKGKELNDAYSKEVNELWQEKVFPKLKKELDDHQQNLVDAIVSPKQSLLGEDYIFKAKTAFGSNEFQHLGYDEKAKFMQQVWLNKAAELKKAGMSDDQIFQSRKEFYYHIAGLAYMTERGNLTSFSLRSYADQTLPQVQKDISELQRELNKSARPFMQESSISPSGNEKRLMEEIGKLQQIEDNLKHINSLPENQKGLFIQGALNQRLTDFIPFVASLTDLPKISNVLAAGRKVRDGKPISPIDQLLLQSETYRNDIESLIQPSYWYTAGKVTSGMFPYIGEFALTGGAYTTTKQAVGKGMEAIAKKAGTTILSAGKMSAQQSAKSGTALIFGETAAGRSAEFLASLTGTISQTAANPQAYIKATMERMQPGMVTAFSEDGTKLLYQLDSSQKGKNEDFETAFLKGFGSTWAEFGTERIGEVIPWMGDTFSKRILKDPDFFKRLSIGYWASRHGLTANEAVQEVLKNNLSWSNVIGEQFEEWINSPLSNLITGDQGVFAGYTEEFFASTALGIGAFMPIASATSFIPRAKSSVSYRDMNQNSVKVDIDNRRLSMLHSLRNAGVMQIRQFRLKELPKFKAGDERIYADKVLNAYESKAAMKKVGTDGMTDVETFTKAKRYLNIPPAHATALLAELNQRMKEQKELASSMPADQTIPVIDPIVPVAGIDLPSPVNVLPIDGGFTMPAAPVAATNEQSEELDEETAAEIEGLKGDIAANASVSAPKIETVGGKEFYSVEGNEYEVKRNKSGELEFEGSATGKAITRKSPNYDQVVAGYVSEKYADAPATEVSAQSEEELYEEISRKSTNPLEILLTAAQADDAERGMSQASAKDLHLSQVHISFNAEDLRTHFGYDISDMANWEAIRSNYYSPDGPGIDQSVADINLSEDSDRFTVNDLWGFIERYPKGLDESTAMGPRTKALGDRFSEITGAPFDRQMLEAFKDVRAKASRIPEADQGAMFDWMDANPTGTIEELKAEVELTEETKTVLDETEAGKWPWEEEGPQQPEADKGSTDVAPVKEKQPKKEVGDVDKQVKALPVYRGIQVLKGGTYKEEGGYFTYDKEEAESYSEKFKGEEFNGIVVERKLKPDAKVLHIVTPNDELIESGEAEYERITGSKYMGEGLNDFDPNFDKDMAALKKAGYDAVAGNTIDGPVLFVINKNALTKPEVTTKESVKEEVEPPSVKKTEESIPKEEVKSEEKIDGEPKSMYGARYSDVVVGNKRLEDILDEHKLSEEEKGILRSAFRNVDYFKFNAKEAEEFENKFANPESLEDVFDVIQGISLQRQSDWDWHNEMNYRNSKEVINYIVDNPNKFSKKEVNAAKEIKTLIDNPESSSQRIYAVDALSQLGLDKNRNAKSKTPKSEVVTPLKDVESTEKAVESALTKDQPNQPTNEKQLPGDFRDLSPEDQGGVFVSSLNKGDAFTLGDKKYSVKSKSEKQTVIVAPNGKNITVKHGFGVNYGNNTANQFFRDIEGELTVDLINENNPLHEFSDVYKKTKQRYSEILNESKPPAAPVKTELDNEIDSFMGLFNDIKKERKNPGIINDPERNAERDIELLSAGMKLLRVAMKTGLHKFADIVGYVAGRVGDNINTILPYLQKAYTSLLGDPETSDADLDQMDDAKIVRNFKLPVTNETEPTLSKEDAFINSVKTAITTGEKLNIVSLRKLAAAQGIPENNDTFIQEQVELAIVQLAREITNRDISDTDKMLLLVDLYNKQPTISMRSSNRIEKQQYSTPIPIAFAADLFVGDQSSYLEPSAGNGMMVIGVDPKKVTVNEIDQARLDNLRKQGFGKVTSQDATQPFNGRYGGIIMNPPFGSAPVKNFDGYNISGLDEQMIATALQSLSANGRAAIIMGGHNSYDDKGRLKSERIFFNYLYNHYNVVDVININGDLYRKQGTGFDIRMVLIDGVKAIPKGVAPLEKDVDSRIVNSFEELFQRIRNFKSNETGLLQPRVDAQPMQGSIVYGEESGQDEGPDIRPSTTEAAGDDTGSGGTTRTPTRPDRRPPKPRGNAPESDTAGDGISNNDERPFSPLEDEVSNGESTDGRENESEGSDGIIPDNNFKPVPGKRDLSQITQEKIAYYPRSKGASVNTVIPSQMADETQRVLTELEEKHGQIDVFVQKQLGYKSIKDLHEAFSAEQIDALAMSIEQANKGDGIIIGDMTGIGKGRIAAGMVRYAVKKGFKPIFITERPNLFSDLYRDLVDIGSSELVPFIINDKSSENDPTITDKDGFVIHKPLTSALKKSTFESGSVPAKYDFVMATYSQFRSSIEKPSLKKQYLANIGAGNIMIMDESHNVSGDSNSGAYFRELLKTTQAVQYLSATFAKRPDNMPVYAEKTAMREANMTSDELVEAISKGGVALQEVVASQLVESGQMIRRERSFEGVEIAYDILDGLKEEHGKLSNVITGVIRDIIEFQNKFIKPLISQMDDEAAAEGGLTEGRKGTSLAGVDSTPFASKVFNIVDQLLFTIKANDVADAAIEELKNNRKPVIAFKNTMGSFLESMGYQPGDVIGNINFSLSLQRGLDGVLRYTVRDAMGNPTYETISLDELSPDARDFYNLVKSKIKNAGAGITISPIDVMIDRIQKAGYTVGEITGRSLTLELKSDGTAIVKKRTEKDVKKTSRQFNNGEIDVILLNAAGATGISLHSSKTFKDQRQRVMISGQLELDINKEIQKRGRTDRTGQLLRSAYRYIVTAIPAERRLLMMFKSKLKSLDANTTSSQKSKQSEVVVEDFLNKYGDEVVLSYLKDEPELNAKLLDPLKLEGKSEEELEELTKYEGAARKVTGRVAILDTKDQEAFYNEIERRYKDHMDFLEANNSNDLEVKTLPLKAKSLGKNTVIYGKGGSSPFGADSILERMEVAILKKPLAKAEVDEQVTASLNGRSATEVSEDLVNQSDAYYQRKMIARENEIVLDYNLKRALVPERVLKEIAKGVTDPSQRAQREADMIEDLNIAEQSVISRMRMKEGNTSSRMNDALGYFKIGEVYDIPQSTSKDASEAIYYSKGILMGIDVNEKSKSPFAPSNVKLRFAVLDGRRQVPIPISRRDFIDSIIATTSFTRDDAKIDIKKNWDDKFSNATRGVRYIITGNLLQAYGTNKGGQLVSFSMEDGEIRKGLLLPEQYDAGEQKVRIPIGMAYNHIRTHRFVMTVDGEVGFSTSINSTSVNFEVPLSRSAGGKYFLNPEIRDLVIGGDFRQRGGRMVGEVNEDNLQKLLDILQNEFNLSIEVGPQGLDQKTKDALEKNNQDQLAKAEKKTMDILDNLDKGLDDAFKDISGAYILPPKPILKAALKIIRYSVKAGFSIARAFRNGYRYIQTTDWYRARVANKNPYDIADLQEMLVDYGVTQATDLDSLDKYLKRIRKFVNGATPAELESALNNLTNFITQRIKSIGNTDTRLFLDAIDKIRKSQGSPTRLATAIINFEKAVDQFIYREQYREAIRAKREARRNLVKGQKFPDIRLLGMELVNLPIVKNREKIPIELLWKYLEAINPLAVKGKELIPNVRKITEVIREVTDWANSIADREEADRGARDTTGADARKEQQMDQWRQDIDRMKASFDPSSILRAPEIDADLQQMIREFLAIDHSGLEYNALKNYWGIMRNLNDNLLVSPNIYNDWVLPSRKQQKVDSVSTMAREVQFYFDNIRELVNKLRNVPKTLWDAKLLRPDPALRYDAPFWNNFIQPLVKAIEKFRIDYQTVAGGLEKLYQKLGKHSLDRAKAAMEVRMWAFANQVDHNRPDIDFKKKLQQSLTNMSQDPLYSDIYNEYLDAYNSLLFAPQEGNEPRLIDLEATYDAFTPAQKAFAQELASLVSERLQPIVQYQQMYVRGENVNFIEGYHPMAVLGGVNVEEATTESQVEALLSNTGMRGTMLSTKAGSMFARTYPNKVFYSFSYPSLMDSIEGTFFDKHLTEPVKEVFGAMISGDFTTAFTSSLASEMRKQMMSMLKHEIGFNEQAKSLEQRLIDSLIRSLTGRALVSIKRFAEAIPNWSVAAPHISDNPYDAVKTIYNSSRNFFDHPREWLEMMRDNGFSVYMRFSTHSEMIDTPGGKSIIIHNPFLNPLKHLRESKVVRKIYDQQNKTKFEQLASDAMTAVANNNVSRMGVLIQQMSIGIGDYVSSFPIWVASFNQYLTKHGYPEWVPGGDNSAIPQEAITAAGNFAENVVDRSVGTSNRGRSAEKTYSFTTEDERKRWYAYALGRFNWFLGVLMFQQTAYFRHHAANLIKGGGEYGRLRSAGVLAGLIAGNVAFNLTTKIIGAIIIGLGGDDEAKKKQLADLGTKEYWARNLGSALLQLSLLGKMPYFSKILMSMGVEALNKYITEEVMDQSYNSYHDALVYSPRLPLPTEWAQSKQVYNAFMPFMSPVQSIYEPIIAGTDMVANGNPTDDALVKFNMMKAALAITNLAITIPFVNKEVYGVLNAAGMPVKASDYDNLRDIKKERTDLKDAAKKEFDSNYAAMDPEIAKERLDSLILEAPNTVESERLQSVKKMLTQPKYDQMTAFDKFLHSYPAAAKAERIKQDLNTMPSEQIKEKLEYYRNLGVISQNIYQELMDEMYLSQHLDQMTPQQRREHRYRMEQRKSK